MKTIRKLTLPANFAPGRLEFFTENFNEIKPLSLAIIDEKPVLWYEEIKNDTGIESPGLRSITVFQFRTGDRFYGDNLVYLGSLVILNQAIHYYMGANNF